MVMQLIMKLGKIVGALLIAAAIIAFATWIIAVSFDLGDTMLGNFLGPMGQGGNPNTIEAMDAGDTVGEFNLDGNITDGFQ